MSTQIQVGDTVTFDGTLGPVDVQYRGRVGDTAVVVFPGGLQLSVDASKVSARCDHGGDSGAWTPGDICPDCGKTLCHTGAGYEWTETHESERA
jgi:hypothetical protein